MPFLRVLRDKRGYETTLLLHWSREGARPRSRILYLFRSPGGVRVGRDALDRDIQRQIETLHPEITFDWNAVRETQQVVEPAPDFRRRRPRRDEADSTPAPSEAEPPRHTAAAAEPSVTQASSPVPSPAVPPRPQFPAALEGESAEERIAFLRLWYPQFRERLALRTADPERKTALLALAERLNPEAWTDADQVTTGLADAADALQRLSRVLARRRRRSRRSGTEPRAHGSRPPDDNAASGASDPPDDGEDG